jgi:hypothetical protein
MRVILINVEAVNQVLYAVGTQKGLIGRARGKKSQIADTKNPGLSTRVFAIDSKQTLALPAA